MTRKGKKPKQQTIESAFTRGLELRDTTLPPGSSEQHREAPSPLLSMGNVFTYSTANRLPPQPHFMPRSQIQQQTQLPYSGEDDDDSDSSELAEERNPVIQGDENDEESELPIQRSRRRQGPDATHNGNSARQQSSSTLRATSIDDNRDNDSSKEPVMTPSSNFPHHGRPGKRAFQDNNEDGDDNDDDDDDMPIPSSAKRRRMLGKRSAGRGVSRNSSDSDSRAPPAATSERATPSGADTDEGRPKQLQTPVRRSSRRARRDPRSTKKKLLESRRRRRLGETIEEEDSSSPDGKEKRGAYDPDPDHPALERFFDEEEDDGPVQQSKEKTTSTPKSQPSTSPANRTGGRVSNPQDDDLEDFVVEDDENDPFGVRAELLRNEIPLEFTSLAHKPLKAHFKNVVEWLVHRRLNPAFDKNDAMYKLAWQKLDDEVRGLAQSKFLSSAWQPNFYKALRARPYFHSGELPPGDLKKSDKCHACNRAGHPASWHINFRGNPYNKSTLDDVESDDEDEENSAEQGEEGDLSPRVDEDGNSIEPASKDWYVGSACYANAETAHHLIHWKHALKDWVESTLESGGYMEPEQCKERELMKSKQRREAANHVVDSWENEGNLRFLWNDFKKNMENARNQQTRQRGR